MTRMYRRSQVRVLRSRLLEPRRRIQVILGPRHTGKSTLVSQAISRLRYRTVVASADGRHDLSSAWIIDQWHEARKLAEGGKNPPALLVLDEIVRIPRWSDVVKALWDEDSRAGRELRVVVVSSVPLWFQKRASAVIAGYVEVIHSTHWAYKEMRDAFGWDLETFLSFGGYPFAADSVPDRRAWESLVWTSRLLKKPVYC